MTGINAFRIHLDTPVNYRAEYSATSTEKTNAPHHVQSHTSENLQISISSEAREKLAKEQSAIGDMLTEQFKQNATKDVDSDKNDSKEEFLDEMIEKTQQQIRDIQQEVRSLSNDNSEKAEQQRKMLETQIITLTATLLNLLGRKLETISA